MTKVVLTKLFVSNLNDILDYIESDNSVVVANYHIIYEYKDNVVYVHDLFDSRRDLNLSENR